MGIPAYIPNIPMDSVDPRSRVYVYVYIHIYIVPDQYIYKLVCCVRKLSFRISYRKLFFTWIT